MNRRGFTMLEMLLAVGILSAFVAVYVAWSTAALRFTQTLDETGGEILADRALEWIVRDYRDQIPDAAFQFDEDADEEETAEQTGETGDEQQGDAEDGEQEETDRDPGGEQSARTQQDERSQGARRLAVTRAGAEAFGLSPDRIEVISPHWAPGEAPGFYEVSYYLRDGSLWRRARPLEGGARRFTVTRGGSTSGDELEILRNVLRFEILPVSDENPRAGAVITLEMELENGEIISRQRIVDTQRSRSRR
jgi:prepilin-type N-terminal cleavage/methylation domain-containing protein